MSPQIARSTSQRLLEAVLIGLPIAFFAGAGWSHRWISDDGFIYLRVVRQVTSGHGPVFNAGERVEAFTSPLWVAVLSVADVVLPVRLEWLAVCLGIAFSLLGLALAATGARSLARRTAPDALLLPVGLLVFVALLPAWAFTTSGLESGLTFAWEGAAFAILADWARDESRRIGVGRSALLGLGWLVRPELALFSAVFLVVIIAGQWRVDRTGGRLRLVAAMFALPFLYQIFRMGFYGRLVANTAIAKEAGQFRWGRGWDYFADFAQPYLLWLPALALLVGAHAPLVLGLARERARRAVLVVGAFVLAGLLHVTYVVAVGGDYIHGRLLMPALFAFCAPVAVTPASRRYVLAMAVVPWAVASALVLRPPHLGEAPVAGGFTLPTEWWGKVTVDQYGWGTDDMKRSWYTGAHVYVQDQPVRYGYRRVDVPVAAGVQLPTAVLRSIGLASFALGPRLHVLDVYGLADPFTANLDGVQHAHSPPRLAGHEKPLPSVWIVARITPAGSDVRAGDFPDTSDPLIPPARGNAFQNQVVWARAAMRCPEIDELLESTRGAFGLGRFFTNVVDSFGNTQRRIPPDPEQAYRHFCGP